MREKLIDALSVKIDKDLVEGLVDSYLKVKNYYQHKYEECLVYGGHFCEFTWKIIEFNATKKKITKLPKKHVLFKQFEEYSALTEQERIIIPRLSGSIYDLRNRKRSGHATDIIPTQNDSYLVHRFCTYVIVEFLLLYHSDKLESILPLTENLIERKSPLIEEINGFYLISQIKSLTLLILYILYTSEKGTLKRQDIGAMLPEFSQRSTNSTVSRLIGERKIFETPDKFLHIRSLGLSYVEDKLDELVGKNS